MFNRLLRSFATAVALWFFNRYRRLSIDLIKLEAAASYLKAIQAVRQGVLSALLLWLGVFIFALGVVMLHTGLFVWLYLLADNLRAVVIGLLSLGCIYVIIILLIVCRAMSERAWMKYFKADKLVADLTRKDRIS